MASAPRRPDIPSQADDIFRMVCRANLEPLRGVIEAKYSLSLADLLAWDTPHACWKSIF